MKLLSCLDEQLPAAIASSLIGGCGLSHKHIEDGCRGTCVKFGGKWDLFGD